MYTTRYLHFSEDSHLFLPPNRYVFQGAEVYDDINGDDDSDLESSDSDPESPDNSSLSSLGDMPTPPTPPTDNPEEASTHVPTTTASSNDPEETSTHAPTTSASSNDPEEASTHAPTTTPASSSPNGQKGLIPLGKETQAEVDATVKALAEEGNNPAEQELLKPSTENSSDSVNQSATSTEATPSGDNVQR